MNDEDTVNMSLLHGGTCLGIGVGDKSHIDGGGCLHLVHEALRDGTLVLIDDRYRHFLR